MAQEVAIIEDLNSIPRKISPIGATRLNLGCGKVLFPKADGWINLDVVPLPGVDVVHDVTTFPYPFEDSTFDYILCSHILEHIPHRIGNEPKDGFFLFLEEIHRILKPQGQVEFLTPYYEGEWAWMDPSHCRVIHPANFDYVTSGGKYGFYTKARFAVLSMKFGEYAWRVEPLVGLRKLKRLASSVFPYLHKRWWVANELLVRLRKE